MPAVTPHCDLNAIDMTRIVADQTAIRDYLPHRPPFEMLTAIVHIDAEEKLIIGYKDIPQDEFWVPGHMPGYPIFPGVLMCEAAAQLSAYFTMSQHIANKTLMGLGGIDNTRFRRTVRPGERLVLVGKGQRLKPRMTFFNVQGYVDGELTFHTDVMGVVLGNIEELARA